MQDLGVIVGAIVSIVALSTLAAGISRVGRKAETASDPKDSTEPVGGKPLDAGPSQSQPAQTTNPAQSSPSPEDNS